jgi:hypothetical protein
VTSNGDGTGMTGNMSVRRNIDWARFERSVSEGAERLTQHIMDVEQLHQAGKPIWPWRLELLLSTYTTQRCLEGVLDDLRQEESASPARQRRTGMRIRP